MLYRGGTLSFLLISLRVPSENYPHGYIPEVILPSGNLPTLRASVRPWGWMLYRGGTLSFLLISLRVASENYPHGYIAEGILPSGNLLTPRASVRPWK